MTKKAAILVLIIMVSAFGMVGCKKKTSSQGQPTSQAEQETEETISGSINDLIKQGKSVQCSFKGEDEKVEFSGIIYVTEKKARQDTESEVDGKKMQTHMIIDDLTAYIWTSEEPDRGVKMTIDLSDEEIKEFGGDVKEAQANYEEFKKKFDFKCKKWKVDLSFFEPPSDVTFTDLTEMMNKMKEVFDNAAEDINTANEPQTPADMPEINMDEMKEMMCQACDKASDPDECRSNLGCD